ncbi:MAG: AraC family transcriptional regulator [Tepidibacter sp.]|uniref:AraC family transcriptional regulator n=1 Tax=Tepidibacter sp. TaxID=2529387 RepID=UPI0025FDF2FA|nr:AraC family transcriptional regulator [Tepidibacter sp.]MCT4507192.1 AraC family transcriptional regulator [Tepidibacter sp.]
MYKKIIIEAIDYIKEHLEEDLSVEKIAEHCHFSKYYFNRIFKSEVGESVYAFIKRLKIERSATQIIREQDKSITEISASYGYSSSNYSTAFKKHYKKSPAVLKKYFTDNKIIENNKGFFADLTNKDYDYYNNKMELVELQDIQVIYNRFIGNYHNLRNHWEGFCENYNMYFDKQSWLIQISYDDPILTDPERCITDICVTTTKNIKSDFATMIIKGGRYMLYNFEGPSAKVFETFQGLFSVWLIKTNHKIELETRKIFIKYNVVDCENNYFSIDIYIPIK